MCRTGESSWGGPLSAAIRRSGPNDLLKLRMCSTCSGTHCPRLIGSPAAIGPAESSSTTNTWLVAMRRASALARVGDIEMPVGL